MYPGYNKPGQYPTPPQGPYGYAQGQPQGPYAAQGQPQGPYAAQGQPQGPYGYDQAQPQAPYGQAQPQGPFGPGVPQGWLGQFGERAPGQTGPYGQVGPQGQGKPPSYKDAQRQGRRVRIKMALEVQRVNRGEPVPTDVIKAPGGETFVVLDEDRAPNSFGLGASTNGTPEAWFPWGGAETNKTSDFSVLVKHPEYTYSWVLAKKILGNPGVYKPVEVDGVAPASFAGRLGKVQLKSLEGWTGWGGREFERNADEVKECQVLCGRKRHDDCRIEYQKCRVGQYPPVDAVQAKQCQFQSYVVLSRDFSEPTFGRASLNKHRDGLQAWFPYDGGEREKESFLLVREGDCSALYWAPLSEVAYEPGRHEVVRVGEYSPAVMNGVLGKCKVKEMRGWTCYDGKEKEHSQDVIMQGTVLCYKPHACDHHVH